METSKSWNPTTKRVFAYNGGMMKKTNHQSPITNHQLMAMRHSCEHVLHQAMTELFPGLKRAMGPATEEGFYHDFDYSGKVTEADFPKIEKRMREIINKKLPIIRQEISLEEAKKLFKNNPYKLDWLKQIKEKGEKATVYWTGEPGKPGSDVDLCKGPHVNNTGEIGAFKLLSIAGAYWHGDEKNKMLTRIYGTCFATQKELDQYLWQQEEAKKRDHRKLGKKLDLFTFSDLVGSGLPLYTPKGALIRRLLNDFVEQIQSAQGYQQVWTPQINKADLFKLSGHYDKYRENLFRVISNYSNEEFFLKPMNCPQHAQIYASKPRSYKDLPLRYTDFAMLYRDEKPGELNGLARVRSFSQDDCHIFCTEEQVDHEVDVALTMIKQIMQSFGFKFRYRLSTSDKKHPEKYLGDPKDWIRVEKWAEKIMKRNKIDYFDGPGEAAFYAPKMDLMATDALGREWQLSTLQIDFFMPQRFNLTYIDKDGKEKRPVMLHRAILGSTERLMMVLLEHYAGALPVWLSPVQVMIVPIADRHVRFAQAQMSKLKTQNLRVETDDRSESMQKKIKEAEEQKIPYMLIVGDREVSENKLAVRQRGEKNLGAMALAEFLAKIKEDIEKKR
jgi:threonyl-tRNA synthetase